MKNLENLSLRGNPLIVDFVNTPIYEPLSLKELAGRAVKNLGIRIDKRVVPDEVCNFLDGSWLRILLPTTPPLRLDHPDGHALARPVMRRTHG